MHIRASVLLYDAWLASLVLIAALLVGGCAAKSPGPPPPPSPYHLQVSYARSLALSDTHVDKVLADAALIARTNDGRGDRECPVPLTRWGTLLPFDGPAIINTQADLQAVLAQPGQVKVVKEIHWCGGSRALNLLACTKIGGTSMVVARVSYFPRQESIVWLHEYAHMRGLDHRNDVGAVMHATVQPSSTMLSKIECDTLTGKE